RLPPPPRRLLPRACADRRRSRPSSDCLSLFRQAQQKKGRASEEARPGIPAIRVGLEVDRRAREEEPTKSIVHLREGVAVAEARRDVATTERRFAVEDVVDADTQVEALSHPRGERQVEVVLLVEMLFRRTGELRRVDRGEVPPADRRTEAVRHRQANAHNVPPLRVGNAAIGKAVAISAEEARARDARERILERQETRSREAGVERPKGAEVARVGCVEVDTPRAQAQARLVDVGQDDERVRAEEQRTAVRSAMDELAEEAVLRRPVKAHASVQHLVEAKAADDVLHVDVEIVDRDREVWNEPRLKDDARRPGVRGLRLQVGVAAEQGLKLVGRVLENVAELLRRDTAQLA